MMSFDDPLEEGKQPHGESNPDYQDENLAS